MDYKNYEYYQEAPDHVKSIIDDMYKDGHGITIKGIIKKCKGVLSKRIDDSDIEEYVEKYSLKGC